MYRMPNLDYEWGNYASKSISMWKPAKPVSAVQIRFSCILTWFVRDLNLHRISPPHPVKYKGYMNDWGHPLYQINLSFFSFIHAFYVFLFELILSNPICCSTSISAVFVVVLGWLANPRTILGVPPWWAPSLEEFNIFGNWLGQFSLFRCESILWENQSIVLFSHSSWVHFWCTMFTVTYWYQTTMPRWEIEHFLNH